MRAIEAVVGVTVAVVVIATLLVPTVDSIGTEAVSMTYDDYLSISSDATATGSVEIVEIGNTHYLHAKDIGEGTVTVNGKTRDITVEKAQLDVYLATGQSNSGYYATNPSVVSDIPHPGTAYYYGTEDKTTCYPGYSITNYAASDYSVYDMIDGNGTLRIGDKGPTFASDYWNYTGHKVLWIAGGQGDTGIGSFRSGGAMYVFEPTIVEDALSHIDTTKFTVNLGGMVWIQGEANKTNVTVSLYKTCFLEWFDMIKAQGFDRCIISLMPERITNPHIAQLELAEGYDDIIIGSDAAENFTKDNGLLATDGIHYSQEGDDIIAHGLAAKAQVGVERVHHATTLTTIAPGVDNLLVVLVPVVICAVVASCAALCLRSRD